MQQTADRPNTRLATNWRSLTALFATPIMLFVAPCLTLLLCLGVVGMLARLQSAILEWQLVRDSPVSLATYRPLHILYRHAGFIAESAISPPDDLLKSSFAGLRQGWRGVLLIINIQFLLFVIAAVLCLRRKLYRTGFRNESRLRPREETRLQLRLSRAVLPAYRLLVPLTLASVPAWYLSMWFLSGLLGSSPQALVRVLRLYDPGNLYPVVAFAAPTLALSIAFLRVPTLVNVVAGDHARTSVPLCGRCGYPLAASPAPCAECGAPPARRRTRRAGRGTRRLNRLPRRVTRWLWILVGVSTGSIFLGAPKLMLDLGCVLSRSPSATTAFTGGVTVYLRSGDSYVLRLEGHTVVFHARCNPLGGLTAAAAWHGTSRASVDTSVFDTPTSTLEQPSLFQTIPAIRLNSHQARLYPPDFFSERFRHEEYVLLTIADRPPGLSITRWTDLNEKDRLGLAELEATARNLTR